MTPIRTGHWLRSRKFKSGCSAAFAVLGLVLLLRFLMPADPVSVRLSAGPDTTRLHAIATWLGEKAAQNHVGTRLLPNAGSEESLELLKSKQLDVAIVSNGVVVPNDDDIVVLAGMQLEAVHLLARKEFVNSGPPMQTILGKRVNLGERGSAEWLLSHDLLAFSKITLPSASHPGDVTPTEYSTSQLLEMSRAIRNAEGETKDALIAALPDYLLVLATIPSPVVQELVESANYDILPLHQARAFMLDNMQNDNNQTTVIEREFLEPTLIPNFSYFAHRGFPAADCETIGVRSLLVARKGLPSAAIRPLMKTVFESEFAHRFQAKSPRDFATPYAMHPAAIAYFDRDKPLIVDSVLDWLNNFISILGAGVACGFSLFSLLWRTRTRSPSDYFAEIRQVEQLARNSDQDSSAPIPQEELRKHLEERLVRLRQDLVEDICEGRIKGDQAISNIMILMKDARRSLASTESQTAEPRQQIFPIWKKAA